jgi:hypothetical protein
VDYTIKELLQKKLVEQKLTVLITATGDQVEYTKVDEWNVFKELGKMTL